jgi:endo-1,4-beta-xylanase
MQDRRTFLKAAAATAAFFSLRAKAQAAAATTLRQAAGDRLLVGAAVMSRQLDDPKLGPLVAREFNCLTAENEMKPLSLQPEKGRFEFGPVDRIVEFCQKNDMKLVGHNLCWHSQSPAWLYMDENRKALPREQALENLKTHIDTVVKHFKGKVIGWDVVNEAISDRKGEYLRDNPAKRAIGEDYIARAFEFAHAADPDAQLYYNDYSNENAEKREKNIKLVRELKKAGVPIFGVGLQSHFQMRFADTARILEEAIRAYAAEGMKVMLTELDVDVLPRATRGAEVGTREQGGANANPYVNGMPPEVAQQQAAFYGKVMDVVMRHPGVVTRVTFWGTHDGTSWLNGFPVRGRTNHALLWDRQLKPKPAYEAVLKALQGGQH